MRLTSEQNAAVGCQDDLMLTACPGSGKTRVIISKIVRTLDELRGGTRKVACITYTNAAVHEIEDRIQIHLQPSDDRYFDVCTIHSFCLNYIFRPFCYLVPGFEKGFKVFTPECEDYEPLISGVCEGFNRYNLNFRDFEDFVQLRVSLEGEPVGNAISSGGITVPMARAYWEALSRAGYVDFANIIYHSLVLIQTRPEILRSVAAKCAWLLVDEFQDTTDIQAEILALIGGEGLTQFLFVGDPDQSIFRFAGARPDLGPKLARRLGARTDLSLSGNFRSSDPIVECAEALISRTPRMAALGPYKKYAEMPVIQNGASAFDVVTDYFLPAVEELKIDLGNCAVLAPTWFALFPLGRKLREYGTPIVGPGARPYRRNRLFAPLAEGMCGYLIKERPDLIANLERTLFFVLQTATGRAHFEVFSYKGRRTVFELIAIAKQLRLTSMDAIKWLESAANRVGDHLVREEYLTPSERNLLVISVEEMKADMRNNGVDLANLSVDDLGIYASPESALKLSTLHNSKGREFDAVAMIDVHEGRIPSYHSRTADDFDEQRRLFYVGITRARRFLLFATDSSDRRNRASRFLADCMPT
jgi:DNA helicase-2/ATP-dependent DNA helicase PcrA